MQPTNHQVLEPLKGIISDKEKKLKKKKKTMDIDYAGIGSNYMFLFWGLLSLVVSVNTLLVTFLPLLITLEANSNPMNQGIKT